MSDPSIERFRRVVSAASAYLDDRRSEVNDLNVFPVADGDTGDNMALTLRAVSEELDRLDGQLVDDIGRTELVNALARAALMGARGNSGVILSQIVRGAAEELASRPGELIDPALVAASMARAADAAYDSVRDPAEGTMLTVFREMAHSVSRSLAHMETIRLDPDTSDADQDAMLAALLEKAVRDGEDAVKRTPEQLEVLREAGVVDAGAHGLVVIMAGIVAGLRTDTGAPAVAHHAAPSGGTRPDHADSRYSYCTNFIVTGTRLNGRSHVPALEKIGDSVLVVGDEVTLKVHVHTDEPQDAVALFEPVGKVSQLDVADMRAQVAQRERRLLRAGRCAVVAVTSGDGVRELFEGLGAFVVDGGETFNPSIYDLLAAIHAVPSEEVLVLPNNPNVVMAAERAAELSDKDARVIDCTAPQAGLSALLELDPGLGADENAARIQAGLEGVRTGSVAAAARDDQQGRFGKGEAVGFVGTEIAAWGSPESTLAATMERLAADAELVTVIGGAEAPIALDALAGHAPSGVELEAHQGGQAHYWWLLAAE